jgi:flagellar biosynthesis protein FlhF
MRRFRVAPPLPAGDAARIALVGPTGVGKTTTAAKLAARYALTEKQRVGLITMDTYRIGAVEQLKTYARVMRLPLEVARTPDEMRDAIDRMSHMDLLLIDTVGRSPRKGEQLAEIREFLDAAEPAETYLTLAAPYGLDYLYETAEQFAAVNPDRLILTKLDEQPGWGAGVSLAERTGIPISDVADGQEVPRNLRPADAAENARMIVGGEA